MVSALDETAPPAVSLSSPATSMTASRSSGSARPTVSSPPPQTHSTTVEASEDHDTVKDVSKHVFLSYIHEDKDHVDDLQSTLEAAGFDVWRDKDQLFPGDNWELKIRQAIQGGTFVFIACFSTALQTRDRSYQNEELALAAGEYRLRPMDTSWLMTVRFDECEIPPVDLGMGRSLERTIHRTDLFGDRKPQELVRLAMAISRVMDSSPGAPSPAVIEAVAKAQRADNTSLDTLRNLLRSPTLVMDFDDYMTTARRPILEALADRARFPITAAGGQIDSDLVRAWLARIHDYEAVIADFMEPLKLIGAYGQTPHEDQLAKTFGALGQESTQEAGLDLLRLAHIYPALVLTYVCALSAESKRNYGMFRGATSDAIVKTLNNRVPFLATAGSQTIPGNWPWLASLLCKEDENIPIDDDLIEALKAGRVGGRYTPISDHIHSLLAPLFVDQFSSDEDYSEAFDRVEVLFDAIAADTRLQKTDFYGGRGGYGRYTYRYRYTDTPVEKVMLEDSKTAGAGWTPLLGGLFGNDSDRAIAALEQVVDNAGYIRRGRH